MARAREEDRGLSTSNAGLLNERFYEGRPWAYFRRRLVHLAMTADPDAELVPPGGLTLTVGRTQIQLDLHDDENDREADVSPIANTRFVAAEGEVLLHHTSETLLRLALAHLPTADGTVPDAPWLALVRERSFEAFKTRVRKHFLDDDEIEVRRTAMQHLFARHPASDDEQADQRLDEFGRYLAYLARVFLDADAYNAAKHGFALRGERSSLDVRVDDLSVVEASGYSFEMLHAVPDPHGQRRWRLTERWYSIDVTVALIWLATALIENLWTVARRRYLGAELPVVFTPPPLSDLLDLEDGDPRRLVEMYSTLRYDDADSATSES